MIATIILSMENVFAAFFSSPYKELMGAKA